MSYLIEFARAMKYVVLLFLFVGAFLGALYAGAEFAGFLGVPLGLQPSVGIFADCVVACVIYAVCKVQSSKRAATQEPTP